MESDFKECDRLIKPTNVSENVAKLNVQRDRFMVVLQSLFQVKNGPVYLACVQVQIGQILIRSNVFFIEMNSPLVVVNGFDLV
jgi:hypothetical protein